METKEIKEYTKKYMEFLKNHKYGDPLPSYVMPIEHDMYSSDFLEVFKQDPKGMKRISKTKLSDNTILRIFNHKDSEYFLAVVEYEDGRLAWTSGLDEHELKSMFHARLPEEYVFSIVQEPEQNMSICIIPKYISDSDFRDVDTSYDLLISEQEPMWLTKWFRSLFDSYLRTSSESIFTSRDESKSIYEMKQILESKGLIYDLDLEESQLENIDLKPEHGASYKTVKK